MENAFFSGYLTGAHHKCFVQAKENSLYGTGNGKSELKYKPWTPK